VAVDGPAVDVQAHSSAAMSAPPAAGPGSDQQHGGCSGTRRKPRSRVDTSGQSIHAQSGVHAELAVKGPQVQILSARPM